MHLLKNTFALLSFVFLSINAFGQQTLKGVILDENNTPIPFAEILVKNDASQRTVSDVHGVYEMRLLPGEYFLVFRSVGYKERETYVAVSANDMEKNMQLFPEKINDLESVSITAKKSNPGREIMLKVVERRDTINPWNYPHSVDVYIKATEKINQKEKTEKELAKEKKEKEKAAAKSNKKKEKEKNKQSNDSNEKDENKQNSGPKQAEDPFDKELKEMQKLTGGMNLVEVQLRRDFAPSNQVKEKRNAYKEHGNKRDLYYTTTVKSNFNFFNNLLHLDDLHYSPVSSPISIPGILSYKYRLVEQYEEEGQKIHKIKIIPRNSATTTLSGFIWVVDSTWLVQKLELTMEKGNLIMYDYFTINQSFDHVGDSLCVLKYQELSYGTKFKSNFTTCKTKATFSNYNFKPNFGKKYFSNELSITEKEAYKKDSTYWTDSRTIKLTEEEQRFIIVRDSLHDYYNRKVYLDSIDSVFNKITALKVLWFGIDHRNRDKKTQWNISSLANTIEPLYIAGPRISPDFGFFKKWENQRVWDFYSSMSMGILNKDLKGNIYSYYLFNPFKFGSFTTYFSHDFDIIQSYNAISQVYKRSNFIESTQMSASMEYELFNGFYVNPEISFSERRNLDTNKYEFVKLLDNALPNNEPTVFKPYQALIAELMIYYIPGQKYMREPNRKVLLGSKWPTFYADYEIGIPTAFGSDVNHSYISVGALQSFKISTFGTSNYHIKAGQFINSKVLKEPDFKYHRQSDPYWFSNPLHSFQSLDTTLPSKRLTLEAHFIHHDNGAIINKIPFMKKTKIGLVGGVGALYVTEFNWQHYEVFVGLERTFKIGRQRLRIGIYDVVSDGNKITPRNEWKFSISFLNNRNMKFNF